VLIADENEVSVSGCSIDSSVKFIQHLQSEYQLNFFDRFYSVNKNLSRKLGGAGLGLSIVKTIIEKHEGKIIVESNPLGGTVFLIIFPQKLA
jgi:signal transduction histidine kinase